MRLFYYSVVFWCKLNLMIVHELTSMATREGQHKRKLAANYCHWSVGLSLKKAYSKSAKAVSIVSRYAVQGTVYII